MWTDKELELLKDHYPNKGKQWCMQALGKTEQQVRHKASALKLKQDRNSEFFKDWQYRAKLSKVGKKRPDQALVMRKLHDAGKLRMTDEQKKKHGEHLKQWLQHNEHPKGATGMKHTNETKQKISKTSKAHWDSMSLDDRSDMALQALKTKRANGNVNVRKASWKSGWREIGGVRKYYRSRWEANYARYLVVLQENNAIASWLHEPTTFWFEAIKRGTRSYLPDFLVTSHDGAEVYHEVKGWMDDASKTKLKRMRIYYPKVVIKLIEKDEYMQIGKQYASQIPDWEYDAKNKL